MSEGVRCLVLTIAHPESHLRGELTRATLRAVEQVDVRTADPLAVLLSSVVDGIVESRERSRMLRHRQRVVVRVVVVRACDVEDHVDGLAGRLDGFLYGTRERTLVV